MKTQVKKVVDQETGAFIEQECAVTFDNGQTFTSGGGWLMQRADNNKWEGVLYATKHEEKSTVQSWDGKLRIPAYFRDYRHNFGGTIRHVWFQWNNIRFYGKFCCDRSELVRVKQINS